MNVKHLCHVWSATAAVAGLALHTGCGGSDSPGSGRNGSSGAMGVGTAGAPSLTDLVTMLTMPMCDTTARSETSCGGTSCPALPDNAATTCTINCCSSDEQCGTRVTDTRIQQLIGSTCNVPVPPDDRCPSVTLAGVTLAGCCDTQGNCGQALGTTCVAIGGTPCSGSVNSAADAGH